MAKQLWEKKDCVSSLQNRIVAALIEGDIPNAVTLAEKLYGGYSNEFIGAITGNAASHDASKLPHDFIDALIEAGIDVVDLLVYVSRSEWKEYIVERAAKPLIAGIDQAVGSANSTPRNDSDARLAAGRKLVKTVKPLIAQLCKLLPPNDIRHVMEADKAGLEILQCSIDYYKNSEDDDSAYKAQELMKVAQSIVIGEMAKQRCKENADIINKIVADMPPVEVMREFRAVNEELQKFSKLPNKIVFAVALLKNTAPYLKTIKAKTNINNPHYLRLSTAVVSGAMNYIIEEVNQTQPVSSFDLLKNALREAWNATLLMDSFDMEADFKNNRYLKNRSILKTMYDQCKALDTSSTRIHVPTLPWGCIVWPAIIAIMMLIGMCS